MTTQDRRAREFQRREGEILAAALRMFNSDSWQNVTIEQIANAVEIGKGTIYKHFTSKDEIYARLALDFHGQVLAELEQLDRTRPVLERLREMLRVYWTLHYGHADVQRVVQYCERDDFRRAISDQTRARFESLDAAFGERLYALLQEGVAEGVLPRKSLRTLLFGAQSTLFGAIRHAHRCRLIGATDAGESTTSNDELREEVIAFIVAGLTNPVGLAA